jgi:hypothetical protein
MSSRTTNAPNELIEVPLANLTSRCPVNQSCALLIGIYGFSAQLSTPYNLTYLGMRSKVNTSQTMQRTLNGSMRETYWFTIPTRLVSRTGSQVFNWTQVMVVGGSSNSENPLVRDVNMMVNVGRYPSTLDDYDYISTSTGPDYLTLTS